MSDENFDYEFEQLMTRIKALEKEVKELKDIKNSVVMQSYNGNFRMAIEIHDSGV